MRGGGHREYRGGQGQQGGYRGSGQGQQSGGGYRGGQQGGYRGGGQGGSGYRGGSQQEGGGPSYGGRRETDRPQSRGEHRGGRPESAQSGRSELELPQHVLESAPAPTEFVPFAPNPMIAQEMECPPPMPPATQLDRQQGLCSLYTLDVQPGRKAYRYDVEIERLPMKKPNGTLDKGIQLCKKAADDGQRALHRNICFELMTVTFNKTGRLGMPNDHELIYDCKSIMFTSTPLCNFDGPEGGQITLKNGDVPKYVRDYCGDGRDVQFTVKIRRNQTVPELDLNDFSQYESGESVFHENRSLRTFFEMAISQHAINTEEFVAVGMGKFYEFPDSNSAQPGVGNGMHLRQGLAKGVKIIKNDGTNGGGNGRSSKPKAAVVLDTKVSAFFTPQKLVHTVLDMLPAMNNHRIPRMNDFSPAEWREAQKLVKDLRVEVNYRKQRTFELGKFTEQPIREIYLDVDMPGGQTQRMSIPQFFEYRYQIELQFVDLPGIKPNTPVQPGRKAEVFPLEVLTVMEDQRVPLGKCSPELMSKLLNANSLLPGERMRQISDLARRLGLFHVHGDNPVLRAFGISVDQKSNRCVLGIRPLPKILFGRGQIVNPDKFKGEWRRDAARLQYIKPTELTNWSVLCSDYNMNIAEQFINQLMSFAQNKGIRISRPEFMRFKSLEYNDRDWSEAFKKLNQENMQFVMLIDEKRKLTHGLLKLYEVFYKPLITQHVTLEKARDIVQKGQRQTLENILNKVNMKNFGLNYEPQIEPCARRFGLESGNVLVIGLDVSHPEPMSGVEKRQMRLAMKGGNGGNSGQQEDLRSLDPSVAGICANMAENPHEFTGDYFYQESRSEQLDFNQLVNRTQWILRTLATNRPNHSRPPCIVVLRDGLSEGQFPMACKEELEAIREGCRRYDPKYKPKIGLVVGTKRHFKKFFADNGFENGRPKIENLLPGTVIQEGKVRADLTECYLQAHAPLKGTGKPVEYSVLENVFNGQDELQAFIMSLCYSHQIVNIATSLPEPVYQADELAKRGKNVYSALKEFFPSSVPRRPLDQQRAQQQGMTIADFRRINEMLSHSINGTIEVSYRFTA